jgi:hypothetical protein
MRSYAEKSGDAAAQRLKSGQALFAGRAEKIVFVDGAVVLQSGSARGARNDFIDSQFVRERNTEEIFRR